MNNPRSVILRRIIPRQFILWKIKLRKFIVKATINYAASERRASLPGETPHG